MAASEPSGDSTDQDWRLTAELRAPDTPFTLHRLLERLLGRDELVSEMKSDLPGEVVITHDGSLLFAYAFTRQALAGARARIESVLREDGVAASVRVSHWDDAHDRWREVDPPPSVEAQARQERAESVEDERQTRAMVASSGKLIRAEVEQTMRQWAARLGLECEVIEHPHILSTQLAFTVTGPRRRIDEFAQGLRAEGWATVRTDTAVMTSPL